VVSAGRAILGIGAGWFELEHQQLGFEFGTFTERFHRLEEAMQILDPMLKGERSTFSGDWYTTESAFANPRYRDQVPIMIGGQGEKKTFAIAARYADHLNMTAAFDQLPAKLDALAKRCDEAGRDRSEIETSVLLTALVSDEASSDQLPAEMSQRMVAGTVEQCAEQIKLKVLDAGIDGVVVNIPLYTPGVLTALGDALRPLVGLSAV
jgi:alkanesulfonate monooxygenase SsuD/methylene tetrahydromethanopterin reductase-like flavin-dependent oxidoreductase (luciferase family)